MTLARRRWPLGLAAIVLVLVSSCPARAQTDESILRGCDALSVGDLQRAKLYFEQAVAGDPTDPLGHIGLGLVYLHAGSSFRAEAVREFSSASALPEALAGLGWTSLASGDPATADLLFGDAAGLADPALPNLQLARCYAALARGDSAAARTFETAGRAENADEALADCLASERYASLENAESAATLAVRARDAFRARAAASLGAIRLNPPRAALAGDSASPRWAPDRTQPSGEILIASPAEGALVTGTVVIHVIVGGRQAGARSYVTVQIDGRGLASTDRRPYQFRWDTGRWPPGPHTISVSVRKNLSDPAAATVERRCTVREGSPSVSRSDAYELCRKRLALWLSTPRLSLDWASTLEHLALGNAEIARRPEPSDFQPLRPGSGELVDPTGPGIGVPLPGTDLGPKVALFFDDGPNPVITPALLEILAREGIHASFFLVGRQCEKLPDLVRRIAAEGHTVGAHSYSHANLANLYPAEVQTEIAGSAELIDNILAEAGAPTPYRVRFFRCPGGNVNATVSQAIQRAGLTALDALSFNTWSRMEEPPEDIAAQAATVTQGVILLHNGDDKSVFVLPLLIRALRAKGCTFITADQMAPGP